LSAHTAGWVWEDPMDRFIALRNLEHFRELLAKETDEAKREQLLRLITEEEVKLKAAEGRREKKQG
jgi:hypothetical protein